MGWKRIGDHSYFYRSRREGGRLSRILGGEIGALCACLAEFDVQEREEQRAEERAEREAAEREERAIREWFDTVEVGRRSAPCWPPGITSITGNGGGSDMAKTTTPAAVESRPPAKMTWDESPRFGRSGREGGPECLPQLRAALTSEDYTNWLRWFRETRGNPADWLKHSLGVSSGGMH